MRGCAAALSRQYFSCFAFFSRRDPGDAIARMSAFVIFQPVNVSVLLYSSFRVPQLHIFFKTFKAAIFVSRHMGHRVVGFRPAAAPKNVGRPKTNWPALPRRWPLVRWKCAAGPTFPAQR